MTNIKNRLQLEFIWMILWSFNISCRDVGNISWLELKANAVKKTEVSSIEAFYATNEGKFPELKDDPTVALYGGDYPLYKNGKIICIVCVSGMAHEDDAKLVEESVIEYLQTK